MPRKRLKVFRNKIPPGIPGEAWIKLTENDLRREKSARAARAARAEKNGGRNRLLFEERRLPAKKRAGMRSGAKSGTDTEQTLRREAET